MVHQTLLRQKMIDCAWAQTDATIQFPSCDDKLFVHFVDFLYGLELFGDISQEMDMFEHFSLTLVPTYKLALQLKSETFADEIHDRICSCILDFDVKVSTEDILEILHKIHPSVNERNKMLFGLAAAWWSLDLQQEKVRPAQISKISRVWPGLPLLVLYAQHEFKDFLKPHVGLPLKHLLIQIPSEKLFCNPPQTKTSIV